MNPGITSPRAGARESRSRGPRDITGRQYEALHAEHARQQEIKANPEAFRKAAWNEGFGIGYDAGAEAGLRSGWCDGWNELAGLLIERGLVTEKQILEIANSTDDQAGTAPGED
jgi:hypothetical protein